MTNTASAAEAAKKRNYVSQADIPSIRLEDALRVPRTIADSYASDPTRPLDIAQALNMSPTSGQFRTLLGAAVGYGLTDGGPRAAEVGLTPVGSRLVNPLAEGDAERAIREAALTPTIAKQFYGKYDGHPVPPDQIAQNVLATFEVPRDKTKQVLGILLANAAFADLTKQIKDKTYIDIGGNGRGGFVVPIETVEDDPWSFEAEDNAALSQPFEKYAQREVSDKIGKSDTNAIFVGHGSNRKPLDQLSKILREYGIPHKVAVEEPNRARPIPQKVAEVMRECGAAILIFTADREYFDREGLSIWRPSDNVSHELGAASVLYGDRIVIFKERGVDLPSNFSSIGYIEFEPDKLSEKGIELFRELVSMKILSISVS